MTRRMDESQRQFNGEAAHRAVVRVGDGRGFLMETVHRSQGCVIRRRIVVTAAHCLPRLPPACTFAYQEEKTYFTLLGLLSDAEPSIATTCEFVDPVADIAVLGQPDDQLWFEEAEAFNTFTDAAKVLGLGELRDGRRRSTGWLLSLDGRWARCTVSALYGGLSIRKAAEGILAGMSGSPILLDDGSVVGVLVGSHGTGPEPYDEADNQPPLADSLPGWLLRELRKRDKVRH